MKIEGKIIKIFETQTFPSGFSKRVFVVQTDEKYPQDIPLELLKDKCSMIDQMQVGDEVSCSINIRGSEYNGKYYASIICWAITSEGSHGESYSAPQTEPQDVDECDPPF